MKPDKLTTEKQRNEKQPANKPNNIECRGTEPRRKHFVRGRKDKPWRVIRYELDSVSSIEIASLNFMEKKNLLITINVTSVTVLYNFLLILKVYKKSLFLSGHSGRD